MQGEKEISPKGQKTKAHSVAGTFYSRSHLLGTDVIYAVKGHSESRNVLPVELRLAESCRFTPSGRGGGMASVLAVSDTLERNNEKSKRVKQSLAEKQLSWR
ncbi:hypothetical protein N5P37_012222 [Trichoderma harzianum]|nr:hypothetical protein N5P37_012222 [Trichoderma harzianum]